MPKRIAIHGFGRIGRSTLKAAFAGQLFVLVAISDIKDLPTLAALFAVASNYGRWQEAVDAARKTLSIGPSATLAARTRAVQSPVSAIFLYHFSWLSILLSFHSDEPPSGDASADDSSSTIARAIASRSTSNASTYGV